MIGAVPRAGALLRRAWRRARNVPVVAAVVRAGDALLWTFVLARSGQVDTEFVAAQVGRSALSTLRASAAYAFGGFRRGLSVRPDTDDVYAARLLPEAERVPPFYSYLRNKASFTGPLHDPRVALPPRRAALQAARDWAAGSARWGQDEVGLDAPTVVIVALGGDPRLTDRLVTALSAGGRVVVAAVGLHMGEWLIVGGLAEGGRLSARLFPSGTDPRRAVDEVLPRSGRFVVIDPRVAPARDQITMLVDAIVPGRITVPVEQAADDTVAAAGLIAHDGASVALFRGLPVEYVDRIGEPFPVSGVAGVSFAAEAPVSEGASVWVDPRVRVRLDPAAPPFADGENGAGVVGHGSASADDLYERAGFVVDGWNGSTPILRRADDRVRWAVKVASLAGPVGDVWGDTHFGEALADALRRLGHDAVVDRREAALRDSSVFDDVHLIVRGPTRLHPPRHGVRVLWIISHPHEITQEEIDEFDHVFAASERWAAEATERWGRPILPLLECTDATRYRPRGLPRSQDILFVGKSRDVPRRVVMAPIEAGVPVRVYGPDWSAYIPEQSVVAPFVSLDELPEMYERAGVVLNDQWAEMREAGFPAMRPFDVVAAGGRVISEYVDGLEEALGPGVVTYRLEAELVALLREDDLDRLFPSDAVLRDNAERVRREHSFDARAAVLDRAVSRRGPGQGRERER